MLIISVDTYEYTSHLKGLQRFIYNDHRRYIIPVSIVAITEISCIFISLRVIIKAIYEVSQFEWDIVCHHCVMKDFIHLAHEWAVRIMCLNINFIYTRTHWMKIDETHSTFIFPHIWIKSESIFACSLLSADFYILIKKNYITPWQYGPRRSFATLKEAFFFFSKEFYSLPLSLSISLSLSLSLSLSMAQQPLKRSDHPLMRLSLSL